MLLCRTYLYEIQQSIVFSGAGRQGGLCPLSLSLQLALLVFYEDSYLFLSLSLLSISHFLFILPTSYFFLLGLILQSVTFRGKLDSQIQDPVLCSLALDYYTIVSALDVPLSGTAVSG